MVDLGGHVTVIKGYKWNPDTQQMEYLLNDPDNGGAVLNVSESELYFEVYSNSSSTIVLEIWGFSAVPKTDYSHMTMLYDAVVYD